jgi:hypothetical protein
MTSDEKSVKMKVVELQKLFNFVVDNFFIWIRLLSQTSNLHSLVVICGQQNYNLDTKHVIGGVVEEGTRKGEVEGLIPNNRVAHEFCAKNAMTGGSRPLLW